MKIEEVFENAKIHIVKDGDDIWFKGKDVALVLGLDGVTPEEDESLQRGGHVYVNEPGLYRLIFSSKLKSAKRFKTWVYELLPSIRGVQPEERQPLNEEALHCQVVRYIRRHYRSAIIVPGLGELQDTPLKRINGYNKGYTGGQPDLIILEPSDMYVGLAIEFKTPRGGGKTSKKQKEYLDKLSENGFKTIVSKDFDEVCEEVDEFFKHW